MEKKRKIKTKDERDLNSVKDFKRNKGKKEYRPSEYSVGIPRNDENK